MKKIFLVLSLIMICFSGLIACSGDDGGDVKIHTHSFTQQVITDTYKKSDATCTQKAVYYKSCSCGEVSTTETFEYGVKLTHIVVDNECVICHNTTLCCEHLELCELVLDKINGLSSPALYKCDECNEQLYKDITTEEINLPVIRLAGEIFSATKENTVSVEVEYDSQDKSFNDNGTIKVQGSTSATFPKKNYTLKLDSKVKLVEEWGKQKKYCLKANYVDFSQSRNVVSAKIYGQIVKSRSIDDEISSLVNGGAVDGYPVLVYCNDQYQGLYTLNIPKDKWLFDMDDSDDKNQAIIMADNWEGASFLKEKIDEDFSNGMELEFYSNEESEIDNSNSWVRDSFNSMVDFINISTDEEFIANISNYVVLDRCIDSLIYTYFICAADNIAKNILWVTYDGTKWFSSVYDLEGTWGMRWDGAFDYTETTLSLNDVYCNKLWQRIYQCYYSDIVDRYIELRTEILTEKNINNMFSEFINSISQIIYDTECKKWTEVLSQDINNLNQIKQFVKDRIKYFDSILTHTLDQ